MADLQKLPARMQFCAAAIAVESVSATGFAAIKKRATSMSVWTRLSEGGRMSLQQWPNVRRSRREGANMRGIVSTTAVVLLFLWTSASGAQSATQDPPAHDSKGRSQPNATSLVARSEMQRPRPLPVTKPLRFPEIPVAACPGNLRFVSTHSAHDAGTPAPVVCSDGSEKPQATAGP
jgi:hypothetical protein